MAQALGFEDWLGDGRREPVIEPDGRAVDLFCRVEGESGAWVTFLHGFPTCSWDWARLAPMRPSGLRWLFIDHLGFGDSAKPPWADYTIPAQLARTRAIWERFGIEETWIVAHDYSVSVVQELLARRLDGVQDSSTRPEIRGVTLLNGGLFYSRIEPLSIQHVLRLPVVGALAARVLPRSRFDASMREIFSKKRPVRDDELDVFWEALTRRGGRRALHKVARHLGERAEKEARWTRALAEADVPLRFVWGLEDPVSGRSILEGVREELSDPDVVELDDVGHYPQIEAPERVFAHLLLPTESGGAPR